VVVGLLAFASAASRGQGGVDAGLSAAGVPSPKPAAVAAGVAAVRWSSIEGRPGFRRVEVTGLAADALEALRNAGWDTATWQGLLAVRVVGGDPLAEVDVPPMRGRYSVEADRLAFEPAYSLVPGLRYRAVFHADRLPGGRPAPGTAVRVAIHDEAASTLPRSEVVAVYPTSEVLPENLLKFYLHFSRPMGRGQSYEHIHLRTVEGEAVSLPFLELDEELWDPGMTRLTLLLDPGRIKRGVKPLEEEGPSMEAGRRYVLVLDAAWRDAEGRPMARAHEKPFRVGPPDREPPDPGRWKIGLPRTGGRGSLEVGFGESLDSALVGRCLRLLDPDGVPWEGEGSLGAEERGWSFVPTGRWKPGRYRLLVSPVLEDLAGNNPGKPFDVDLAQGGRGAAGAGPVEVSFVLP
jgi:hypothetical protein